MFLLAPIIANRARSGARLMDELFPGWAERIDKARLDMANVCDCVRGQVFGDYYNGPERGRIGNDEVIYGFNAPVITFGSTDFYFWRLRLAWLREIKARQGAIA